MNLPYGNGETCTPTPSEYLYAGLQRDGESGLDHAESRQYSSMFGQRTTPYPYGGSYDWSNPQSLNRYAYVGGNPLTMVDPSGEDGCFLPGDGIITCPISMEEKIGTSLGLGTAAWADSPFMAVAGPIGMLIDAGELFDNLGQSFGWWGGSPFHGSVAASQSEKNVPGASIVNVPGPPEGGIAPNNSQDRLHCAAQFANQFSIAGVTGLDNYHGFGSSFLNAALGNTFSGFVDAFDAGAGRNGKSGFDLYPMGVAGGPLLGMPLPDSAYPGLQVPLNVAVAPAINAATTTSITTLAGETVVGDSMAFPLAVAKFGFDAFTFAAGYIGCHP